MTEERTATGIAGFDSLVQGGFPRRTVNLLAGPAGSGKSLFAIQFLLHGAAQGEPGLYVTLEESRENLQRLLASFRLDAGAWEADGRFTLVDLGSIRQDGGETIGFAELREFLKGALAATKARRLVIDSVSAAGLHYGTPESLRREMFAFTRFLRGAGVTTLLITESLEGQGLTRFGLEQFLADSFVVLDLEESAGEFRRTITVRKMRFTLHDVAKHPVLIGPNGLEVSSEERVL